MEKNKNKFTGKSSEALHFSQVNLEANRQGYMSYGQREQLKKDRKTMLQFFIFFSFICSFGIAIIGLFLFIPSDETIIQRFFLIPVEIYLIVAQIALLKGLLDTLKIFNSDLEKGHVENIKGYVTGRWDIPNKQTTVWYYLKIQEEEFQVPKNAYFATTENVPYIVYYLPNTRKVLSIEQDNTATT